MTQDRDRRHIDSGMNERGRQTEPERKRNTD